MTKEEAANIISGYEVYGCGYCLTGDDEVEEALRMAIDVLKQETVIRCKDCKYLPGTPRLYSDDDPVERYIHCGHLGEDGFCSFAKRKEE